MLERVLPRGFFLAVHQETGVLAASAMATHCPMPMHPFGGELGWVAGHPGHAGKGLGLVVCAAALRRFLDAGYERIYLKTDDWRLPALKTYLKLGFEPFLFQAGMAERWKKIGTVTYFCPNSAARMTETT
jgi:mycothiol synthase